MLGFTFLISSLDFSGTVNVAAYRRSLQHLMCRDVEPGIRPLEPHSSRTTLRDAGTRLSECNSFEHFRQVSREAFYRGYGKSIKASHVGLDPQFMWHSSDQFE